MGRLKVLTTTLSVLLLVGCSTTSAPTTHQTSSSVPQQSTHPQTTARTVTVIQPARSASAPSPGAPVPDAVVSTAQQSLMSIGCNLPGGTFQSQGTAWMVAGPPQPSLQGAGSAVTASHVVTACGQGSQVQAFGPEGLSLGYNDVTHDLALVSVSGEISVPLPIETSPPHVGEQLALLGAAQQQPEVTQGQVVAINVKQTLSGEGSTETLADAIKVRASAIHGESGGPAIDAAGKVVGVIEGVDPSGAYATLTPVSDLPGGATQEPAQPSPAPNTTPTTPSAQAASPPLPTECGPGLATTKGTSCGFANNVFYKYWTAANGDPSQNETVQAWGPATKQSYTMTCQPNNQAVLCTNNANGLDVEFTAQAILNYTQKQATAYAQSGKLGP